MVVKISELTNSRDWDNFVDKSVNGDIFQLSAWKNIVEKSYNHKSIFLIAKKNDNIVGLLPLFIIKSRFYKKSLVSLPFVPHAGVCSNSRKITEILVSKAIDLAKDEDAQYLEIRNSNSSISDKLVTSENYKTSVIELPKTYDDFIYKVIRKNKRKTIQKSSRTGLSVSWTKNTSNFFSIYTENMRDLGSPGHSKDFFINIIKELPNNAIIQEVRKENKVIYSAFYLFYKKRMINVWSSALREARNFYATDFGISNAINYGINNEYEFYDFGRSQNGSTNMEFKRRWGAKHSQLYYHFSLNGIFSNPDISSNSQKRIFFSRVWKKIPLSMAHKLGSHLRRGIP